MDPAQWSALLALSLFAGMMLCLEVGYRLGQRHSQQPSTDAHEGIGTIEAAVFALLGLLLGFSFAGGTSRLDARRELIVKEANAIGTAYLRLDLLPAKDQPEFHRLFRNYLDARLTAYQKLPDLNAARQSLDLGAKIQQEIWAGAVKSGAADSTQNIDRLLLPALNDMFDVTTSRTVALSTHMPPLIFGLLIIIALLSGLLAGYAMAERKKRSAMHMTLYALVIAFTVYAVLDLDYPRSGLIRLTAADNALHQLRDSIH